MIRLKTDFNEVFDEDYVWTSLRRSPSPDPVTEGDWVELYDEDGETCWALVTARQGPIVVGKIDWSTWRALVTDVSSSWRFPSRPRQLERSVSVTQGAGELSGV